MRDTPNRRPDERRAEERYPVNADTSCPFASPAVEDFGPVKIKDVSMGGVALLTPRPVPEGALLALTLVNPRKGFTKTVLVRVTHSGPSGGGFLVGGSFTVPLTYQEMSTLVL